MIVLNVLLAIAWGAVTGDMSEANLLIGFGIGYAVLWLTNRRGTGSEYFAKFGKVFGFALYFLWELLLASLRVAVDIVTPRHLMRPAILAIPLGDRTPAEIVMLANSITLTPGTLSLDVSDDNQTLFVHVMYAGDVEAARKAIEKGMGRRIKEVFR